MPAIADLNQGQYLVRCWLLTDQCHGAAISEHGSCAWAVALLGYIAWFLTMVSQGTMFHGSVTVKTEDQHLKDFAGIAQAT